MPQPVQTKLSLEEWRKVVGLNPLHFWGVQIDEVQHNALCDRAWFQSDWQNHDRVSRDEVATAIADAEAEIEDHLGYRLLPSWEEDEWQPSIRPYRRELFNATNTRLRGQGQTVPLRWGWLLSGGIRSSELISAGETITWSDTRPPSTYNDLGTIQDLATAAIDPEEIRVYYPGHGGDPLWEIRPANVTIANGLASISFERYLCVAEDRLDTFDLSQDVLRPASGTEDGEFLSTVDVYRVYNDPQQQATMLWEPAGACTCGGTDSCEGCAYSAQTACLLLTGDPKLSMPVYKPATWDATTLQFTHQPLTKARQPDLVRFWYYAGYRDKNSDAPKTKMARDWARTVAGLAVARLDRSLCDCSQEFWKRMRVDRGQNASNQAAATSYQISASDLDNPFGTRQGEIMAWKHVQRRGVRMSRGGLVA